MRRQNVRVLAVASVALVYVSGLATTTSAASEHRCLGRVATIVGTPSDDYMHGTPAPDVFVGLGGEDDIDSDDDDIACGNKGPDGFSSGLMVGGRGGDYFPVEGPNDRVRGGPGQDEISLYKFEGVRVRAGSGSDLLVAALPFHHRESELVIDLKRGYVAADIGRAQISGVENAEGCSDGDAPMLMIGDEHDNRLGSECGEHLTIRGGGGDDLLRGGVSEDRLFGGPGNDRLTSNGAGDGNGEVLHGGPGRDVASFRGTAFREGTVVASLATGLAKITSPNTILGGTLQMMSIESLIGSRGRDAFVGDDAFNVLVGGRGADVLDGRGNFDQARGGRGLDACLGALSASDCNSPSAWIFPLLGPGRDPWRRSE
jgi:Ca2+-binding RTX toxin-like protein